MTFQPLLRGLSTAVTAAGRPSRPDGRADASLSASERRRCGALMRVNHAGETAAQGLYTGQALLARRAGTKALLLTAAQEESDHLEACVRRLAELDSRVSYLTPFWFLGSLAVGAAAALPGDRFSLGFVAETERQVEAHLNRHLERLPQADHGSRELLRSMRDDEVRHGRTAEQAGGAALPPPVRRAMRRAARLMTGTAYWV